MIITIGTTNPAKIEAVKLAFTQIFPHDSIEVLGVSVESGISAQPMSDEETILGATNRAQRSLALYPEAQFGVGLEGGLQQIGNDWYDCGWCVIIDQTGTKGVASSARIPTPPSIMKHIHQGLELGEAIDLIFNRTNAKQAEGHVGLITDKHATRTGIYTDAIIIAFSRFLHPEIF